MFEEVRVSNNGSGNNAGNNAGGSTGNTFAYNSVGILDETTQSSWSGFEGRINNGAAHFKPDPLPPISAPASSDVFLEVGADPRKLSVDLSIDRWVDRWFDRTIDGSIDRGLVRSLSIELICI